MHLENLNQRRYREIAVKQLIQTNLRGTMKIGKLDRVDIRQLWKGEATDFTPWLAQDANIAILSEAIGIELEVVGQESSVGPFRADILCKSTIDNHYVLVENQLEKTDHTHLGQLMTYAAGLDAVTIIWIAKQFTEEHRAAVDWLNRITDDNFNFFGIEIDAYKIDESVPAPLFQIVSKPNDWSKLVKKSASTVDLTPAQSFNILYWQAMKDYFVKAGTFIKCQKPQPQAFMNFSLGRGNFLLGCVASYRDKFIRVELVFIGNQAKTYYSEIKGKYFQDVMEEFGEEIVWSENPGKKQSYVSLKRDCDTTDESNWPEQHKWILEHLENFDKFFRPKIKLLPK